MLKTSRPLNPSDIAAVCLIEQQVQQHPWSYKLLEQSFGPRSLNLALEDENQQLIGYLFSQVIAGEAELLNISVAQGSQQEGGGHYLMNDWITQLQVSAVERILLEVRQSNHRAIRLYQQFNFAQDSIRSHYYPTANGFEDAILMSRSLD